MRLAFLVNTVSKTTQERAYVSRTRFSSQKNVARKMRANYRNYPALRFSFIPNDSRSSRNSSLIWHHGPSSRRSTGVCWDQLTGLRQNEKRVASNITASSPRILRTTCTTKSRHFVSRVGGGTNFGSWHPSRGQEESDFVATGIWPTCYVIFITAASFRRAIV